MTTTQRSETNLEVANTIANQIGNRAFFMMGTRIKLGDERSLMFDIRGSRTVNKCRVTLEASDTYKVEFFKVRGLAVKTVSTFEMIYGDGLNQVIARATGLFLSL